MSRRLENFLDDPRNTTAARLLTTELEMMRPSALKHEYLASVANAWRHQVGEPIRHADGSMVVAGWGDRDRTLPLMLVLGAPVNGRRLIHHAHIPYVDSYAARMSHPDDHRVALILQADEVAWAATHSMDNDGPVRPRSIVSIIERRGIDFVNARGLPYPDGVRMNATDAAEFAGWYETDLLAVGADLSTANMADDHDREVIESRVTASLRENLRNPAIDKRSLIAHLQQRRGRLEATDVEYRRPRGPDGPQL